MQKPLTKKDKWIIAVVSALLFLVIASPFLYLLTNRLFSKFGWPTHDASNNPTLFGLCLHALVFGLLVRVGMR